MTVLRRMITVPVGTILMVALLVAGPVLLAAAAVVGLATRTSRPARTVALLMAYAVIELRTLVRALRGERDCDQLVQDFLTAAYAAVRRILDVEVVLDSASAMPDAIPRDEPVIVLSRHCGPGDSVLVAWLLAVEYRLQLRIVLKAVLQCEPALDLAGELGCLISSAEATGRAVKSIARLSHWSAARRCCCSQRARTSPCRGGTPRSPNSVRPAEFALRAARCGNRTRCHRAAAALPPRWREHRAPTCSCLLTAASVRMDGRVPGGGYPSTGKCSSEPFWYRPPVFRRRTSWAPGSTERGPKSIPGWPHIPGLPGTVRSSHPSGV